jgi:hypothetical protein
MVLKSLPQLEEGLTHRFVNKTTVGTNSSPQFELVNWDSKKEKALMGLACFSNKLGKHDFS